VRGLLGLAVRGDPAVAHGFAAARDALNQIDPKLPSAVVRCAFNGVIRPRIRYYDPQPDDEARRVDAVARAKRGVDSEVASLCGKADEPQWPRFPESHARPRERLYIITDTVNQRGQRPPAFGAGMKSRGPVVFSPLNPK